MVSKNPLEQLGYDLMAAAFEVHQTLGGGLSEEIYQESLEHELSLRKIPFVSKPSLGVTYKGHALRKTYSPDLLIKDILVVELKSVAKLLNEHEAQILNYMRISQYRVGYLINFAPLDRAEWKRFIL